MTRGAPVRSNSAETGLFLRGRQEKMEAESVNTIPCQGARARAARPRDRAGKHRKTHRKPPAQGARAGWSFRQCWLWGLGRTRRQRGSLNGGTDQVRDRTASEGLLPSRFPRSDTPCALLSRALNWRPPAGTVSCAGSRAKGAFAPRARPRCSRSCFWRRWRFVSEVEEAKGHSWHEHGLAERWPWRAP